MYVKYVWQMMYRDIARQRTQSAGSIDQPAEHIWGIRIGHLLPFTLTLVLVTQDLLTEIIRT